MPSGLKLYVWEGEGVLEDNGTGLVCVLAESVEDAWNVLKDTGSAAYDSLSGWDGEEEVVNPVEYTTKKAFICWGGG